jgi:hypothetical protein
MVMNEEKNLLLNPELNSTDQMDSDMRVKGKNRFLFKPTPLRNLLNKTRVALDAHLVG